MAEFKIKKTVPGINAKTKGGKLVKKVFTTSDPAWIKELRKLPKATVEEVAEPESE